MLEKCSFMLADNSGKARLNCFIGLRVLAHLAIYI